MDTANMAGRGWYSRGYLPHIDVEGSSQFLGWRLNDAVPGSLIKRWRSELAATDLLEARKRLELARKIEKYCDEGHGSCLLRQPLAARAVHSTLVSNHHVLYRLHAWVVMPNHVHAVLTPLEGVSLGKVLKEVKGASSRAVNKALAQSGTLWEPDFFDRLIRNEKHFVAACRYVEWNPVKAKLCTDPRVWRWSSAHPESLRSLEERSRTEVRESGAE